MVAILLFLSPGPGQHLYSDSEESDSFAGEDLFSRSQFAPRHQARPLPFMFPPPPPGPPPGDPELYIQCKSDCWTLEDKSDCYRFTSKYFSFCFFSLLFSPCMHLFYSLPILSIYIFLFLQLHWPTVMFFISLDI